MPEKVTKFKGRCGEQGGIGCLLPASLNFRALIRNNGAGSFGGL
jgi:hypothetical protein